MKIFPRGQNYIKAEIDYKHELSIHRIAHENASPNKDQLVLFLESGRGEKPFKQPIGGTIEEYNYLLTPGHSKGYLIDLLMRSERNK